MNCIMLITSKGYEDMTKICLYSLLEHNLKNVSILLYVDGNISEYAEFKNQIEIMPIDFKIPIIYKVNKNLTVPNLDIIAHRLFILDKLKYKYDKIMLLDVDTLILEDFSEIFDLDDNFIYGCNHYNYHKDFTEPRRLKPLVNEKQPLFYFNCGVLLLPSKQLKRFNLFAEFLKELYVNGNDYVCPEQDLLNRIFDNKQNLDDCYNYTPRNIFQQQIKIVHFAGPSKPNKVEDFVLLLDNKIYLKYFSYIRKYKNKISKQFFEEVENKINNFYEFVKINNIDLCNILKIK